MNNIYKIETSLHTSDYTGLKITRIKSDSVSCSEIPRTLVKYLFTNRKKQQEKDVDDLRQNDCLGIYFLVNYKNFQLYISKTTNGLESIFNEIFEGEKKPWFTHILFFRKDYPTQMNQAVLNYVEWYFIDKVVASKLSEDNNQVIMSEPEISDINERVANKVIRSINILLMDSSLKLQSSEIIDGDYDDVSEYTTYSGDLKEIVKSDRLKPNQLSYTNKFPEKQNRFESIIHNVINKRDSGIRSQGLTFPKKKLTVNKRETINFNSSHENSFSWPKINQDANFDLRKLKSERPTTTDFNQANRPKISDRFKTMATLKQQNKVDFQKKIQFNEDLKASLKAEFPNPATRISDGLKKMGSSSQPTQHQKKDNQFFVCNNAKGEYHNGFINLLQGSIIKKAELDLEKLDFNQASIRVRYKEQVDWLNKYLIKPINDGQEYLLLDDIKDIPINIATQHVTGSISDHGKELWINSQGQTIRNIE